MNTKNILAASGRELGNDLEEHKGIPLDYGYDLQQPTTIAKLFSHHEDRDKIMDIIHKGTQYHQLPIEEGTRKSDLATMILHGNQKSSKENFNAAA